MKSLVLRCINFLHRYRLRQLGERINIDPSARLLRGFCVRFLAPQELKLKRYLDIGARSIVNANFFFESSTGNVSIGERCYIGADSSIICRDRIKIGNDVTIAWGVTIYDHDSHSPDWHQRAKVVSHFYKHYGNASCFEDIDWTGVKSAPILIGDRAWLGFDVVVLKGVTIGEGAIVGARSVVTRDVEPYTVVAGNPARLIRRLPTELQGME